MALIKCKECSAPIAENAQFCPACGFTYELPKAKNLFQAFNTVSGPLIVSAATALLGFMAFMHKTETQETEKLQTMIESAVGTDPVKGRTAIRIVSYLAKENRLSGSVALSILGTVARNADPKLRSEAYDAIENLTEDDSFISTKFDQYDQLEIFCLHAALTPAQYWRQVNLSKIEERIELHKVKQSVRDRLFKFQAASKLLSLSQDVSKSNPQATIDILLSVPIRLNDPEILEKAIPILCEAVRNRSGKGVDNDVVDTLASVVDSVAKESVTAPRESARSQIRLYLACALVTKDEAVKESSLKEVARIVALNPNLKDDTEQLFDVVAKSGAQDANLSRTMDEARDLILQNEKLPTPLTKK
jgi:hypothetical protein